MQSKLGSALVRDFDHEVLSQIALEATRRAMWCEQDARQLVAGDATIQSLRHDARAFQALADAIVKITYDP